MIKRCTCESLYQDRVYGKGLRVWNPTQKGRRCTVCGTTIIEESSKEISSKSQKKRGR